jgi:glycosyltransferase involved in cell wall biosynthesis
MKTETTEQEVPFATVIMATYNDAPEHVEKAIESILNQTFSNFELIITDDSTDVRTIQTINSFADKDKRIRVIKNDCRIGLVKSLNAGLREARGQYIVRMDADDVSAANRFEKQIRFLEENEEYVLVSSCSFFIDKLGNTIPNLGRTFPILSNSVLQDSLDYRNTIFQSSVVVRKKALLEVGGYVEVIAMEDWLLWGKLRKYGKFKQLPDVLISYRILPSSLFHSLDLDSIYYHFSVCLLKKMMKEDIKSDDIQLFNTIYSEAKKIKSTALPSKNKMMNIYKVTSYLFPANISAALVGYISTTYYFMLNRKHQKMRKQRF